MLDIITLKVIQMIFENAEIEVSQMTKMVYINCLIHHFKDKKATLNNSVAFEVFDTDFDFQKFKKNFQELHKAGIVTLNGSIITFNNVWGKHIDRTKLDVEETETNSRINFIPADKLKDELLKSQSLLDVCRMRYKLSNEQITNLINLFIIEQTAFNKTYNNPNDCLKHFTYWLNYNKDKSEIKESVKVKSKGKLLGK